MKRLLSQILAAGIGLWLATILVPGVTVQTYPDSHIFGIPLTNQWQLFVVLAITIGLLNHFAKPILNALSFPIRIITLGLFNFLINMVLVFAADYIFKEFSAPWLYPLFWTTFIIWAFHVIILKAIPEEE